MINNIDEKKNPDVIIYERFEDITPFQEEWDNFVDSIGGEVFLTFDWSKIWWQYYGKGRKLRIYIFRDNDDIVGILPMFFEKIRVIFFTVRVCKIICSDFTLAQFTLPIRKEYYELCLKGLFEDLKRIKWHILYVGPLAGISADIDTNLFKEAFHKTAENNVNIKIAADMVQTYYELESTWEKYFKSLKRNQRKEISHKYNLLERHFPGSIPGLKTVFADEICINSFYKDFVSLHQQHWERMGNLGHFGDWPDSYNFHYAIAKVQLAKQRLRLIRITLNDELLGYVYAYKFGDRYYAILNSRVESEKYNKIGIGTIIACEYIKAAIGEKVMLVDSMRGKYNYKLKLGGKLFTIKKIYITKNDINNSIRVNVFCLIAKLLDLFYYRIWFVRLASKLPFKKSSLWRLWIRTEGYKDAR